MKNIINFILLLISLFSFSLSEESFGQDTTKTKKVEIGIQISSPEVYSWYSSPTNFADYMYLWGTSKSNLFATGVFCQYSLKKGLIVRMRGSYTSTYLKYTDTIYSGVSPNYIYVFQYKQNIFVVAPGILSKVSLGKFNFYGSLELPIKIFGDIHKSHTYYFYSNGSYTGYNVDKYDVDGGLAFGIGSSFGFKYLLCKRFFIGPEFSEAILYHYVDGKVVNTFSGYDVNGNLTYGGKPSTRVSKKSGILMPLLIFSLNLSYGL